VTATVTIAASAFTYCVIDALISSRTSEGVFPETRKSPTSGIVIVPSGRTIALPFFSKMTSKQVDRVCQVLEKTLEKLLVSRKGRF
jgi:hypothetical protein